MNLQKYNQRLLAIIGTLALAALTLTILISLTVFIIDQISWRSNQNSNNGVVIDHNQVVDTTAFSFTQEISLLEPYQLDSLKPVFIIPIGQKDQKSRRTKLAAAGLGFRGSELADSYYYSNFYGLYNNFVLIDYLREIKVPVFKSKVAITEWAYTKIDSSRLIIFKGTSRDVNKDGLLNDDDLQSLFVYNINSLELKELFFENETVREFNPLFKTSKIYVRTGKDIDNDLYFDYASEPTDLYFYDIETGESEALVPEMVKNQIRDILN